MTSQWQFFEILEDKLSPQKSLRWIPFVVATYNISKNSFVHRRCLSDYCEKNHIQKRSLWSSIFVKKILLLDLLWVGVRKMEFFWGVLERAFDCFGNSQNFLFFTWISLYPICTYFLVTCSWFYLHSYTNNFDLFIFNLI